MTELQTEMREAVRMSNFHSHLRKNAQETYKNIIVKKQQTFEYILVLFQPKSTSHRNCKPQQSTNGINSLLILTWKHYHISLKSSMNVPEEHLEPSRNKW